jgi:hypothetical protein
MKLSTTLMISAALFSAGAQAGTLSNNVTENNTSIHDIQLVYILDDGEKRKYEAPKYWVEYMQPMKMQKDEVAVFPAFNIQPSMAFGAHGKDICQVNYTDHGDPEHFNEVSICIRTDGLKNPKPEGCAKYEEHVLDNTFVSICETATMGMGRK